MFIQLQKKESNVSQRYIVLNILIDTLRLGQSTG